MTLAPAIASAWLPPLPSSNPPRLSEVWNPSVEHQFWILMPSSLGLPPSLIEPFLDQQKGRYKERMKREQNKQRTERLARKPLRVSAAVFLLAKRNLFPADPLNERPISGRPDERKVQELISYISPVSLLEPRLTTLDPHEYPKTRRPFILKIRPPPLHPFLQSINPSGRPLPDRNPERVPQRAGI